VGADHSAQASKRFQGELIVVAFWSARQWLLMGTSGWSHRSWRGPFFPMRLPVKRHLEYYATQFEIVELNGVFYRTPSAESVARWGDETGRHFVFAWKASKFISHWKRLTENSTNSLQLLEHWLSILGEKVGPVLFQLPPDFAADAGRLSGVEVPDPLWTYAEIGVGKLYADAQADSLENETAALAKFDECRAPTMLPAARSPLRNNSELRLVAFGRQRQCAYGKDIAVRNLLRESAFPRC
jgi:Protein of unknown function DUF72